MSAQVSVIPRNALVWLQTVATSYGAIAVMGRIDSVVRTYDGDYITLWTDRHNRHVYRMDDVDRITLLQEEGINNG